jgi:alpha-ribazole phosphatase
MATRMIFIRHGDTGNPWGVFVGSTDADLVEGTLEKAKELGEGLMPEGVRAIYTSRLQRAWKTAETIGKVLGIRPVRMKELNEVDFGEWEMKWFKDIKRDYPSIWKMRERDYLNFNFPGGESVIKARDRAMPVIRELFRKHEGEAFAVVAHGSLIKIAYSTLTGMPIEEIAGKQYNPLCALFFKKDGDKIVLEREQGVVNG